MAENQPIQQRVSVDYDGKGAVEAARDMRAIGEASQQAGQAAQQSNAPLQTRTAILQGMRAELVELLGQQAQYNAQLTQGQAASEQDVAQASERADRIERIAVALARQQDVERAATAEVQKHTQAAKEQARSTDEATRATERTLRPARSREQALQSIRSRLEEVIRQDILHRQTMERSGQASDGDTAATERRRLQKERLGAILREEDRLQARVNQEVARATTAKGQLGEATGKADDSLVKFLGTVGRTAGGLVGVTSAASALLLVLRQVSAELDNIKDRQDKAFGAQVDLASAQRSLKLNLAGESQETIDSALAASRKIAGEANVDEAQITLALAQSISATGGNLPRAVALTQLAARVRPDQPGEIAGIAGAVGDVGNAINTSDPLAALGYLQLVGKQSRVADSSKQFRNIPGAITGLVGAGFDRAAAGGLFAAQTVGAADVTGEMTGTSLINFGQQLKKFFEERGRAETGEAAIRSLQRDPSLRETFLADLSIEAKQRAPIEELLQPGSEMDRLFTANVAQYGDHGSLRRVAEGNLTSLETGAAETTANVDRTFKSTIDQLRIRDREGGIAGAVRKNLVEALKASGQADLASKVNGLRFELDGGALNGDAIATAVRLIEEREQELANPVTKLGLMAATGGGIDPKSIPRRAPTARERESAQLLGGLVEGLQQIGADYSKLGPEPTNLPPAPTLDNEAPVAPTRNIKPKAMKPEEKRRRAEQLVAKRQTEGLTPDEQSDLDALVAEFRQQKSAKDALDAMVDPDSANRRRRGGGSGSAPDLESLNVGPSSAAPAASDRAMAAGGAQSAGTVINVHGTVIHHGRDPYRIGEPYQTTGAA